MQLDRPGFDPTADDRGQHPYDPEQDEQTSDLTSIHVAALRRAVEAAKALRWSQHRDRRRPSESFPNTGPRRAFSVIGLLRRLGAMTEPDWQGRAETAATNLESVIEALELVLQRDDLPSPATTDITQALKLLTAVHKKLTPYGHWPQNESDAAPPV
jgi:hypothetical protein